jgi:hypothetical protein
MVTCQCCSGCGSRTRLATGTVRHAQLQLSTAACLCSSGCGSRTHLALGTRPSAARRQMRRAIKVWWRSSTAVRSEVTLVAGSGWRWSRGLTDFDCLSVPRVRSSVCNDQSDTESVSGPMDHSVDCVLGDCDCRSAFSVRYGRVDPTAQPASAAQPLHLGSRQSMLSASTPPSGVAPIYAFCIQ